MGNASTISGTALSAPVAPEPNLCRVSGYLRDVQGNPLRGVGIVIRHVYNPIGQATEVLVLRERQTVRSDGDGFLQFDLLRSATVDVELPNRLLDHVLHCVVPDAASVDLIDFLFPYVASVEFVTADPVTADVGESVVLELNAVLSNGVVVKLDGASTTLLSSDEAVLQKSGGFVFNALVPGSASVYVDAFNAAPLMLQLQPDGTPVSIQTMPSPTLPASITVNVL